MSARIAPAPNEALDLGGYVFPPRQDRRASINRLAPLPVTGHGSYSRQAGGGRDDTADVDTPRGSMTPGDSGMHTGRTPQPVAPNPESTIAHPADYESPGPYYSPTHERAHHDNGSAEVEALGSMHGDEHDSFAGPRPSTINLAQVSQQRPTISRSPVDEAHAHLLYSPFHHQIDVPKSAPATLTSTPELQAEVEAEAHARRRDSTESAYEVNNGHSQVYHDHTSGHTCTGCLKEEVARHRAIVGSRSYQDRSPIDDDAGQKLDHGPHASPGDDLMFEDAGRDEHNEFRRDFSAMPDFGMSDNDDDNDFEGDYQLESDENMDDGDEYLDGSPANFSAPKSKSKSSPSSKRAKSKTQAKRKTGPAARRAQYIGKPLYMPSPAAMLAPGTTRVSAGALATKKGTAFFPGMNKTGVVQTEEDFAHLSNDKKSRGRRPAGDSRDFQPIRLAQAGKVPQPGEVAYSGVTKTGLAKKVFQCLVPGCNKLFKRSEHLKRHVRSMHTDEKPFQCQWPDCGKRFSRHDNLSQHLRTHRTDDMSEFDFAEALQSYFKEPEHRYQDDDDVDEDGPMPVPLPGQDRAMESAMLAMTDPFRPALDPVPEASPSQASTPPGLEHQEPVQVEVRAIPNSKKGRKKISKTNQSSSLSSSNNNRSSMSNAPPQFQEPVWGTPTADEDRQWDEQ
ncbi:hypothetical protein ACM66B_001485 [Microbotryomycetes sp. NB124-2]